MKIYIDQSGKIEQTNKPTVLAFSNGIRNAILIPTKIKRQLQGIYRRGGRQRIFIYKTFAIGVFFLIEKYLARIDEVVIDIEYPGKEILIREIILSNIKKRKFRRFPEINFSKIGRKSKAHDLAWKVFKRKIKANRILTLKEFQGE